MNLYNNILKDDGFLSKEIARFRKNDLFNKGDKDKFLEKQRKITEDYNKIQQYNSNSKLLFKNINTDSMFNFSKESNDSIYESNVFNEYKPINNINKPRGKQMELMATELAQRPFPCNYPGCKRAFKRFEHLKRHNKMHTGEKPFVCKFPGCGRMFSRSDNLNAHYKTHNISAKRIKELTEQSSSKGNITNFYTCKNL